MTLHTAHDNYAVTMAGCRRLKERLKKLKADRSLQAKIRAAGKARAKSNQCARRAMNAYHAAKTALLAKLKVRVGYTWHPELLKAVAAAVGCSQRNLVKHLASAGYRALTIIETNATKNDPEIARLSTAWTAASERFAVVSRVYDDLVQETEDLKFRMRDLEHGAKNLGSVDYYSVERSLDLIATGDLAVPGYTDEARDDS